MLLRSLIGSKDIELGYEEADMGRVLSLPFQKLEMATTLSVVDRLKTEQSTIGVVGYCLVAC